MRVLAPPQIGPGRLRLHPAVLDERLRGENVREIEYSWQGPPKEKTELLRALIADLDGPADPGAQQAWLEVAKRRDQEIKEGKVETVPMEQVFKKVRALLKR